MTSQRTDQSYGIPAPITKLTMEQDLKRRVIEDRLNEGYHDNKEDIITWIVALQHQNFVLSNSLTNLVKKWPQQPPVIQMDPATIKEVAKMFGTLSETRD